MTERKNVISEAPMSGSSMWSRDQDRHMMVKRKCESPRDETTRRRQQQKMMSKSHSVCLARRSLSAYIMFSLVVVSCLGDRQDRV